MKARKVLPIGFVAAIVCGAVLSGNMPTRMLGTNEPKAMHMPNREAGNLYSTAGIGESGPFDLGPGLPDQSEALANNEEDRAESALYGGDLPVEMSPNELARAWDNPDYAVIPDDFADAPKPLPAAPRTNELSTYPDLSRREIAPRSPADTQPPTRRARTLDPIY